MTKRKDTQADGKKRLCEPTSLSPEEAQEQPWLIDAHCHLDDEAYDGEREGIIAALENEHVEAVINPGCDAESSRRAVSLARTHDPIFACIGTHPHEASGYTRAWEEEMRSLSQEPKVVAMGEIGLDYHYDLSPRKIQQEVFARQLELARELQLPVVIHSREACEDTLAILRLFGSSIRVLMHSFNEERKYWKELASFGYYLSLGGMVTFKNAHWPKELAKAVMRDRLLVETDGPYLAPVPYRGRTNMPWYARQTLYTFATLREEPLAELAAQVRQNTIAFFGLPLSTRAENATLTAQQAGVKGTFPVQGEGEACVFKK